MYFEKFHANANPNPNPLVICEGKTDSLYIKCAMKSLIAKFPGFVDTSRQEPDWSISFFKHSYLNLDLMQFSGGTGDYPYFMRHYADRMKRFLCAGQTQPVILLVDNDKGSNEVFKKAAKMGGKSVDGTEQFYNKAPLDPNRKAMGNLLGHAVRSGSPADILAVGEGLETMLSLRLALPGLPIAAALSGNHLAAFDPPADLRRLYVAIDNDEAGQAAFDTLTDRFAENELHLLPLRPLLDDCNSDLRKCGVHEMRSHLRPQLSPVDVSDLLAAENC